MPKSVSVSSRRAILSFLRSLASCTNYAVKSSYVGGKCDFMGFGIGALAIVLKAKEQRVATG